MDGQTKPKLLYVEDAELEAGFERRAGRGRAFIRYNYHLKPTTTTSSSFRSGPIVHLVWIIIILPSIV
ncbi:hypothetical protein PGT21_029496 [Puccinia graminis f. sp. tritici]|uniref:Uncharacterized protein n=1 Tax=Puccinia graminis f. sp. tritici TaxID=56615 RepID=A0A5B0P5S7_PUCGR|nr:hypothetical protein PGT21_029496 [Puccinia graminis f. sp. tritici]